MLNPQALNVQSIMPSFKWLISNKLDISTTARKVKVMQFLGVPYPEGYDKIANQDLIKQATEISENLKASGIQCDPDKEIIAVIAYLQRLGTDITRTGPAVSFPLSSNK